MKGKSILDYPLSWCGEPMDTSFFCLSSRSLYILNWKLVRNSTWKVSYCCFQVLCFGKKNQDITSLPSYWDYGECSADGLCPNDRGKLSKIFMQLRTTKRVGRGRAWGDGAVLPGNDVWKIFGALWMRHVKL